MTTVFHKIQHSVIIYNVKRNTMDIIERELQDRIEIVFNEAYFSIIDELIDGQN